MRVALDYKNCFLNTSSVMTIFLRIVPLIQRIMEVRTVKQLTLKETIGIVHLIVSAHVVIQYIIMMSLIKPCIIIIFGLNRTKCIIFNTTF